MYRERETYKVNYALYREYILGSINTKFKAKLQRKGNDSVRLTTDLVIYTFCLYLFMIVLISKVSWKEGRFGLKTFGLDN